MSISSQNSLVGGISPWQVLESLGESVVIVGDRFRVVWIKEPLLAQSKPGVNPFLTAQPVEEISWPISTVTWRY